MMRGRLAFHIVDVFADKPLEGNPLAVVEGGEDLPDDVLKRIAREFNQSETTFIIPPRLPGADHALRSFTAAGVEVNGAGHNALGAWWWLAEAGKLRLEGRETAFRQEIGGEVLLLTVRAKYGRPEWIEMRQEAPRFGQVIRDIGRLAEALSLQPLDFAAEAQVVSTGTAHLMVPLQSADAVDRAIADQPSLKSLLAGVGAEGCYIFSRNARHPDAQAYSRFFNPTVGLWEDPATGTAAGPLAALTASADPSKASAFVIEQGTKMGRTSLIRVSADGDRVTVAGRGVTVADGTIRAL